MIAYKLLALRKDGTVGPLFINRKLVIEIGKWMDSELHPTKGFQVRQGWHVMAKPEAPHLSNKGRQWFVVEIEDYTSYTRPAKQGGLWYLANRMRLLAPVFPNLVSLAPKLKQSEFSF